MSKKKSLKKVHFDTIVKQYTEAITELQILKFKIENLFIKEIQTKSDEILDFFNYRRKESAEIVTLNLKKAFNEYSNFLESLNIEELKKRKQKINTLKNYFLFTENQEKEISFFLLKNPNLICILYDAYKEISQYFSDPLLILEIVSEDTETLFIKVYLDSILSEEAMIKTFDLLDERWWSKQLNKVGNLLSLTIEYSNP